MLNTLVKHALANVWCTPFQDAQALLKLTRATAFGGARDYVNVMKQRIALPDKDNRFHLYQIGQNDPARFKLEIRAGVWFRFSDVTESLNKIVELYTADGVQFCRSECYVLYTRSQSFVVAVRMHPGTANLNAENLYLRFYSNAYYDSQRAAGLTDTIETGGRIVETTVQSVAIQNEFHQYRAKPVGFAYAFHNGRYVHDFPPNVVKSGDSVEWIYDASIERVVDLRLDDLPTFTSELDGVRKYLVHPPKGHNEIDYRDDLDFWIIYKSGNSIDGVYYHKNSEIAVRMVTHADYSIPVGYVQNYLDANPGWDQGNVFIRIHFRKSGYSRPLVYEANAIHELYKLNDTQIVQAMIGNAALVPAWKVNTLEQSNYTRIMRSLVGQITGQEVYSAYGYDATARLIGNMPLPVLAGAAAVPIGLMVNSTAFEYDAQGLLLGISPHYSGETYTPQFANTTQVELIAGVAKEWFCQTEPTGTTFAMDPLQTQRFYVCRIIQGVRDNQWFDVTEDTDYVVIQNGIATFVYDPDAFVVQVRGTEWALVQPLALPLNDNVLDFSITNRNPDNFSVAYVPCGKLELWLNGRSLIENVDYYVQWPRVVVVNKSWLLPLAATQSVVVRGTGVCNPDLTRTVTQQMGFVRNQTLSINNRFDICDAKVLRCVVGGRMVDRSKLEFAESLTGVLLPSVPDGSPYAIDPQLVPIPGVRPHDVYYLKSQGDRTNETISDYLSVRLPEPQFPHTPIAERYRVVSPTMAAMIHAMINGFVAPPASADNNAVIEAFVPFREWLQYEPAVREIDDNFIVVIAHPFDDVQNVTVDQYRFLERINALYLRNKVELSHYVGISTNPVVTITDPHWDQVVYQLRFDGVAGGTNIIDDKSPVWVAMNDAQLVGSGDVTRGTVLSLDTASAVPNGVNSRRVFTNDVAGSNLDGDFTLEYWLKTNQTGVENAEVVIDTQSPQGSGDFVFPAGWFQFMLGWNNTLEIYVGIDGQYYQTMISAENCLILDAWNHVAWVRKNGVSKLFVNGQNVTSTYSSDFSIVDGGLLDPHNYGQFQQWILGIWNPGYGGFATRNVWLDDLRLTNGVARYDAAFDPSAVEFYIPG